MILRIQKKKKYLIRKKIKKKKMKSLNFSKEEKIEQKLKYLKVELELVKKL